MTTQTPTPLDEKKREIRCIDGGIGYGFPEPDVTSSIQAFLTELKEEMEKEYDKQVNLEDNGHFCWVEVEQVIDKTASKHFGSLVGDKNEN